MAPTSSLPSPRVAPYHYEQSPENMSQATFRCHPKGTGVICKAKEGLAADIFVAEYLGYDTDDDNDCDVMVVMAVVAVM